jgi:hypothetical protein
MPSEITQDKYRVVIDRILRRLPVEGRNAPGGWMTISSPKSIDFVFAFTEFRIPDENTLADSAKHDSGKVRFDLVQWDFVQGIADVLAFGASKYAENAWQNVPNAKPRYFAATIRHVTAWWAGELLDSESGLPHIHHAACNLMFLFHFDKQR